MIDLKKEREAFEEMAHEMGMCLDQYWGDGFDNPYENDDTSLAYNIFREGAKSKQAEITELKQKLEKLESGEFFLVPREPTLEMLKAADKHVMDCHATPESAYKVMIEAVEKGHE